MNIGKLDHINIRTTQLDTMIDWYTNILGLCAGDRPKFSFPGAWMYAGDTAVVHLVGISGAPGVGSEVELKLEHFAFTGTGSAEFEEKLRAMGVQCRRVELPSINIVQFNVWDPDGNHIHVDFATDE